MEPGLGIRSLAPHAKERVRSPIAFEVGCHSSALAMAEVQGGIIPAWALPPGVPLPQTLSCEPQQSFQPGRGTDNPGDCSPRPLVSEHFGTGLGWYRHTLRQYVE